MKNVKKIVLYSVIAVAIIIVVIVAKNKFFPSGSKQEVAVMSTKTSVEVQKAKSTEKSSGDIYKANLEPYEQGIISSKLSAKVVQVLFEDGQSVSQGDTLIVLDDQDITNQLKTAEGQLKISESQLNSAQASLPKIQTGIDTAQRNYDRMKNLFEQEAISLTDFETVETTLKNAKADYDAAKANIETSKANMELSKVSISNLQDSVKNTIIKAPLSGVMDGKSVNIGQVATPGTALAKVNDISSIYAVIQVSQENMQNIKLGQAAVVKIKNGDKDNTTYEGIIKSIDLSADSSARVFNCKIQIDNEDKSLHTGIFAKVQIISGEKTQMLSIPIEALAGNEGQYYVLINDNGTARKQEVTIGETNENVVEIKSGIESENEIICTNISTLQDGDEIEVVSE